MEIPNVLLIDFLHKMRNINESYYYKLLDEVKQIHQRKIRRNYLKYDCFLQ